MWKHSLRCVMLTISLGAAMHGDDTNVPKKGTGAPQRTRKESGPIRGFAVAPMVLKDEGCARDYVRAFQFEGVELRKRLVDLNTYGCIDTTATGIFAGLSTDRKDLDR